MPLLRAAGARCVRWRYLVLTLWAAPWVALGFRVPRPAGDWAFVEMGARILAHHDAPVTAGPALHLYATFPLIQMGPPALWLAAPFQWLPPAVEEHLALVLLSLLVLPMLWCLELAARSVAPSGRLATKALLAGVVVVPAWVIETETWGHIDDAVALAAVAMTLLLVSRGRREVLAGLLLGTAAAAKPWAAILLPVLFAYARPQIARAALAFVVSALLWWLPFVLAAPDTIHELGSFSLLMYNHPTWQLVGLAGGRAPSWIRTLQLLGGTALSAVVVRRAGWAAVPVVALAWRVTTDPYDWPYYVLGPLVGAALWDLTRPALRRLAKWPWATLAALFVGVAVPRVLPASAPVMRLLWFGGLTVVVLLASRARCERPATTSTGVEDAKRMAVASVG